PTGGTRMVDDDASRQPPGPRRPGDPASWRREKALPRGGAYKCRVEHMPSVIQQQASRYDSPRGKSAFSEQVVQPAGTSLPRVHDGLYDFRTTEPNLGMFAVSSKLAPTAVFCG